MLDTCDRVVRSVMASSRAMALFAFPAPTRPRTSSSREVSAAPGLLVPLADPASRPDAVDGLHLHVHQDDVGTAPLGVEALERSERFLSAAHVRDNVEVRLAPQEGEEAPAHHGMVVDDENPDGPGVR